MKAHLMFKDRDFDLRQNLPPNRAALTQDLELKTLWGAMAQGDGFLLDVAEKATLQSLREPNEICYRQAVLRDALAHADVVQALYAVAVEAVENERKEYIGLFEDNPEAVLHRSVRVMRLFSASLGKLKALADEHAPAFRSEGLVSFCRMIQDELNDAYFAEMQGHLKEMEFKTGILISAGLGAGCQIAEPVLRRPNPSRLNWAEKLFAKKPPSYTLTVDPRDESGVRALMRLENRGLNLAADALAQSVEHILGFFRQMRAELGFYIGCLRLKAQLDALGEPTALPQPCPAGERRLSFHELYDVCLCLTKGEKVVGNDLDAEGKSLVVVTGANQGGKSTFLRSMGLSLLMMQCGIFVPARDYQANACAALFTHYKREEDDSMQSGKLDEELARMSDIVEALTPDAAVLFNESFAATNEREGSEIARQVVDALLEKRIQVLFVTHFFALADGYYRRGLKNALFLRAQRQPDGSRSFKLTEGAPLKTSYGEDLYRKVFTEDASR